MPSNRPPSKDDNSDSENDDRDSDSGTPAPKRRVCDFERDEGDYDDEDIRLEGLGTSTHRSRNPDKPVQAVRKRGKIIVEGDNARATAVKKADDKKNRFAALQVDLNSLEAEREERAAVLAAKHKIKLPEVRRRMHASSTYKQKRAVSSYNAKVSAVMADLNEGERDTFFLFFSPLTLFQTARLGRSTACARSS